MRYWFKNISFKYKGLIAIIILLTTTTISNMILINGIKKINYDALKVYKEDLNVIEELHDVKESLLVVKNLITLSTFNKDVDLEYVKNKTNENIKHDDEILDRFEKKGIPETVEPIYLEFKSDLYKVRSLRSSVVDKISVLDYESALQNYSEYVLDRDKMYDGLDELILRIHEHSASNYNNKLIAFDNVYRNIFIVDAAVFLFLIFSGMFASNYFASRLRRYVSFAKGIAKGTASDFIFVDSDDELGQLGKQLNITKRNINSYLEEMRLSEKKLKEQLMTLSDMEGKLRVSEERYRLAVDGASDGIWDIDLRTSKVYFSDKCKEVLNINIPENEQTCSRMGEILKDNVYQHITELSDTVARYVRGDSEFIAENFKFNINGVLTYILFRGKILRDQNGNVVRVAGSVTDVTEQNLASDKVKYLAYYDALTKLPNKISLRKDIPELFKGISRKGFRALVLVDVDNFKYINEVYGHEIGDELILEVTKRLKKMKSASDTLYYAGGASFAFYSDKYVNQIEIEKEAEQINKVINSPYFVKNNKISITASIGISYLPLENEGTLTVLQNAEIALNFCKMNKETPFVFFTSGMENSIKRKVSIHNELISAVENGQFTLFYQPKVNIKNGKIEGMEALIRWNHPADGVVGPNEFISIAEETGVIVDIGYYVIQEACTQIKKWHEKGYSMLKMAVNLSIKQLLQVDFVEKVTKILESTGIRPEWLEFEITESLVMKNYKDAIFKISELKKLGITIALDDFGTGYSSLNYLSSLPIDSIKLDKTFIDKIIKEEKNKAIIQSFIQLAHSIELSIIAEGVETEEQLYLLKQLNCDLVQGYYFSKPLKTEEFEKFIKDNIENYREEKNELVK